MTTKKQGRPRTKAATDQGSATAGVEKEQIDNGGTSNKETPEAETAKSEEKVIDSEEISGVEKSEFDKLKEENAKFKAELAKKEPTGKVVEVNTGTKKPKLTNIRRQNNLHDVYVKGRLRSMTKQSYEAIAKDPKLDVSLPKGTTLVEPNIQPCVDC